MVRYFICSAWLFSCWASAQDVQFHGALLRVAGLWYGANLNLEFKRRPELDSHHFVGPSGTASHIDQNWSIESGKYRLASDTPAEIWGKAPTDTIQFEGYCLGTQSGEVYCRQETAGRTTLQREYRQVDVSGVEGRITDLSGSEDHVCALTDSGRIYCWGINRQGRLGIGGAPFIQLPENDGDWSVVTPTPPIPFPTRQVLAPGGTRFLQVTANDTTGCGLTDDAENNVYCWGRLSTCSGCERKFELISQTASGTARQIDFSALPLKRLEGVGVGLSWSAGWDANNAVYAWGRTPVEQSLPDTLALKPVSLGSLPATHKILSIRAIGAEVCALTIHGPAATPEVFCTRSNHHNHTVLERVFP